MLYPTSVSAPPGGIGSLVASEGTAQWDTAVNKKKCTHSTRQSEALSDIKWGAEDRLYNRIRRDHLPERCDRHL
jgi:hypothetical protein